MLSFLDITKDFADIHVINQLNEEAFPQEERLEIDRLISLAKKQLVELKAVYDHQLFIGFYSLTKYQSTIYLFFIAVDKELRSKGYGSQILNQLQDIYSSYQIVIDVEPVIMDCQNYHQRVIRKQFYLRNHYHETGYYMTYSHMTFELLCNQENFDKEDFISLLQTISSKYFQPIVHNL